MDQLLLASAVFLATHFVSSTPLRPAVVGAIGEKAWLGLYTVVSFLTIGWMVWAYNRAPVEALWEGWRLAPAILMPFSFILLVSGLFVRNPSAVGQAKALKADEPARGMLRITRHPVMWSFILWSLAHLLAQGQLKSLVFFGTFLVLAALGALLIDMRKEKTLGDDWKRFAKVTSYFPFLAIAAGRNRFDLKEIGARNIVLGLAVYAILFWAHPMLFGARAW
jgi:uncharacterized membrane protein